MSYDNYTPYAPTMINVLIADEHALRRTMLQSAIEQYAEQHGDECVVAFSDDGLVAFRKAKRLQPELVLMSATLPHSGGAQLVMAIQHYAPQTKLVIIGDAHQRADLRHYANTGVDGVFEIDDTAQTLSACLMSVLSGEKYFVPRA